MVIDAPLFAAAQAPLLHEPRAVAVQLPPEESSSEIVAASAVASTVNATPAAAKPAVQGAPAGAHQRQER